MTILTSRLGLTLVSTVGSEACFPYSAGGPTDQTQDYCLPREYPVDRHTISLLDSHFRGIPSVTSLSFCDEEKMVNPAQSHFGLRLTALSSCARSPKYSMRARVGPGALSLSSIGIGPGSYNIPSSFRSRSYYHTIARHYFGTSGRSRVCVLTNFVCESQLARGGNTPGPGAYSTSGPSSRKPCSFGSSIRDLSNVDSGNVPGPGAYTAANRSVESPSFTFGHRHERITRSLSPSPTAYSLSSCLTTPTWSFGSSSRSDLVGPRAPSPGPGSYNIVPESLGGPSFSMKSRTKLASGITATPGPTGYGGLYTQFD